MVRLLVVCGCLLAASDALRHKPSTNSSLVHLEHTGRTAQWQKLRVRSGIEELESWKDSGKAVSCRLADTELRASVGAVTNASYGAQLQGLVQMVPSRFVADVGNDKVATFLNDELKTLGFQVQEQPVHVSSAAPWGSNGVRNRGNVIGFLKGTDLASEVVVFGAHYDSVNWQAVKSGVAPGADDNGSGVAALLQIAKVLSEEHREGKLRRSIVLTAFQAEEVGLFGSKAFVSELLKKGVFGKPVATVIADEVSFPGRPQHARQAIFETKGRTPANVAMIDTFAHQAHADGALKGFEVNYAGFGSDHIPFLEAGYPAVLLIERDNMWFADTYGHTKGDSLANTDASFGAAMTRLAARVVLSYASPA